ncbi:hypothetical protein H696_03591 [Fonticula alba]|uniref:Uncharacterized protein n=1 Tax=Fonticula alba TaxID=691883 RepID=A0A058Z788_FONAL|nr:hypothetical protein H696_03591 [Fonticula alba]KCV70130.1 hypothetical protein H696_03591 [Fonticula alba]|eukprot:XP_009495736.1 hypothetical protein H696_03591 [Fonticula alba]
MSARPLIPLWLGRVQYARALSLQTKLSTRLVASIEAANLPQRDPGFRSMHDQSGLDRPVSPNFPNFLLLLEHPPTYAAGRRLKAPGLRQERRTEAERLVSLGSDYYQDASLRGYVRRLEDSLSTGSRLFCVPTMMTDDPGVWTLDGLRKVAALVAIDINQCLPSIAYIVSQAMHPIPVAPATTRALRNQVLPVLSALNSVPNSAMSSSPFTLSEADQQIRNFWFPRTEPSAFRQFLSAERHRDALLSLLPQRSLAAALDCGLLDIASLNDIQDIFASTNVALDSINEQPALGIHNLDEIEASEDRAAAVAAAAAAAEHVATANGSA